MSSENNVGELLKNAMEKSSVGSKISLNFNGAPQLIEVEMTFKGGWVVSQTILPGKPFEFTKGEDGFLENINITIKPFDGIKNADSLIDSK